MTKTRVGSELVAGPGASFRILGMPLGRHALSVECLKPWTVAAEHLVEGPWTTVLPPSDDHVGLCLPGFSHLPNSGTFCLMPRGCATSIGYFPKDHVHLRSTAFQGLALR